MSSSFSFFRLMMSSHFLLTAFTCLILSTTMITEALKAEEKPLHNYPPEVTKTFMKGCEFTETKKFCTCSFDKLRQNYTFAEFTKVDNNIRETRQVPEDVSALFKSCRNSNPSSN